MSTNRPAIARRSCDQCRARKIGCDRGSPCSGCVNARLECTHSVAVQRSVAPRQRVHVSAQYEQKIDEIARNIESIKLFLESLDTTHGSKPRQSTSASVRVTENAHQTLPLQQDLDRTRCAEEHGLLLKDDSTQIGRFVEEIVEDRISPSSSIEINDVLASFRNLLRSLDNSNPHRDLSFPGVKPYIPGDNSSMPPLDATALVLRWAKNHRTHYRLLWISRILPLEKFTEVCQKVYFAVDDFCEVDFILANGYLFWIFSEYIITSGSAMYRDYCTQCQQNLQNALAQLPLLLPASMDVVAALVIGALHAMDSSKATMAWMFTSTASNLCQALGYHRRSPERKNDGPMQSVEKNLFWTVYDLDKSLSLRLGRPSNIPESEITLAPDVNEMRCVKVARIKGKVYDQLYSTRGLSRSDEERSHAAEILAAEVRELITRCQDEDLNSPLEPDTALGDITRTIYIKGEQVIEYSLLALILRAIPSQNKHHVGVSDACIAAAQNALDLHEQCISVLWKCINDPLLRARYINWTILHTPFVAFIILFSRAIETSDKAILSLLDRFSTSLEPSIASLESMTHPHRLYKLLCEAARLRIESNTSPDPFGQMVIDEFPDHPRLFDFAPFGSESRAILHGAEQYSLIDWHYDSQQIMALLDDDVMF